MYHLDEEILKNLPAAFHRIVTSSQLFFHSCYAIHICAYCQTWIERESQLESMIITTGLALNGLVSTELTCPVATVCVYNIEVRVKFSPESTLRPRSARARGGGLRMRTGRRFNTTRVT